MATKVRGQTPPIIEHPPSTTGNLRAEKRKSQSIWADGRLRQSNHHCKIFMIAFWPAFTDPRFGMATGKRSR